ncbi:hypothetical protein MTR_2g034330 [Medicago truncatula]|uniref:Uncharacterized protein n=1 Tax=Medicago truncatula TaxID=3880 RepID=G7IFZ1_MEDTR|nr:hypothetical protein MTR_2g034330 [Medicago truncatula]
MVVDRPSREVIVTDNRIKKNKRPIEVVALHLADAIRWDMVVFESDSSTLVEALSSSGHAASEHLVHYPWGFKHIFRKEIAIHYQRSNKALW